MRAGRRPWILGSLVLAVAAVTLAPRAALPIAGRLAGDAAVGAALTTAPDRGEPLIVLLVGSDRRQGAGERSAELPGERADAVLLLQVVPAAAAVRLLSLPRDLLVEVDGRGREKLAVAYQAGSAAFVRAVRRLTGLPVHHFLAADFQGFALLVDRLGGVALDFRHPARDRWTGFRVRPGRRTLDGTMALAYVRARNYEELVARRWRPDRTGDLGRIDRQQRLFRALAVKARRVASPAGVLGLARAVRGHVTVDRGLGGRALGLLRLLGVGGPEAIAARTLPVEPTVSPAARVSPFPPLHVGTFSYLRPRQPQAGIMLAAFRSGRPLPTDQGAPP